MKKIISILLLLAVWLSVEAQRKKNQDDVYITKETKENTSESKEQIPKNTYKIIIKNDLSQDENFTLVGRTLIDNEIPIKEKDREFGAIKTELIGLEKNSRGMLYVLYFTIRDKSIILTGRGDVILGSVNNLISENNLPQIKNYGMKGSPARKFFSKMNEFALKLGGELEYITE